MRLHPTQKLSSSCSSPDLASLGARPGEGSRAAGLGIVCGSPSSPPLPLLAVVTTSVTSGTNQAFTMLCAPVPFVS